ncbi:MULTISPECIES: short-chain dehydrogenase [unclassified Niallia]|uniref:short-chain dehydrogenase n=1 Tax=unclassified Niallia TaxID=2837522 RepID=UPI001EDC80CA|nr:MULTISPECIES: short-chain dehydrogenase [unclassified Niallia]MDL0434266.1 short-chain dehydrogenase [Niallia sp. SS-2023]UPO89019.1 short-chain dehydrogenase [Niallia sp. Man26]
MKHALVVGGKGMLSEVTIWLAKQGYIVSVIGRNKHRMDEIRTICPNSIIHPILVDYSKLEDLESELRNTIRIHTNIELVVAWIHSYAEEAVNLIIDTVSKDSSTWQLFHVLGSNADLQVLQSRLTDKRNMIYHQIQLGFMMDDGHSRWLTNKEIASGVIQAMINKKSIHIVGVTEPREQRP